MSLLQTASVWENKVTIPNAAVNDNAKTAFIKRFFPRKHGEMTSHTSELKTLLCPINKNKFLALFHKLSTWDALAFKTIYSAFCKNKK